MGYKVENIKKDISPKAIEETKNIHQISTTSPLVKTSTATIIDHFEDDDHLYSEVMLAMNSQNDKTKQINKPNESNSYTPLSLTDSISLRKSSSSLPPLIPYFWLLSSTLSDPSHTTSSSSFSSNNQLRALNKIDNIVILLPDKNDQHVDSNVIDEHNLIIEKIVKNENKNQVYLRGSHR
mmetsp:Transcript_359/g.351  ORF Transcript_359/g.351 Transcript_359/m.351 type:complete len:180 (-) Transcript_359:166-705(-)